MSSGINLASTTSESVSQQISPHIRTVRYIAIGILFLVATTSVVFFILIATSPQSRLKQEESDSQATLSKYNTEIVKLLRAQERLTTIDSIIKQRPSVTNMTESVGGKLPSEVTLQAFKVKGKTLTVTVGSNSLTSIDNFINQTKDAVKTKEYARVVLTDLSVDAQHGEFVATVQIAFL